MRLQLKPVVGETVALRATVPVNALTAPTVIVEVPVEPDTKLTGVVADRVKSGTGTVTVTYTIRS